MADVLYEISHRFKGFTSSHKTVANYILENVNSIAFDTLEELSKKIGVSTTTIIRFAKELGFDGYSGLQKGIQAYVKEKVSLPERLIESKTKNLKQDELLMKSFDNDIHNIKDTLNNISFRDINDAVDLIIGAENVYIMGFRSSFALAYYLYTRLGEQRKHIHLVQSVGMSFPEDIVSAGKNDVCIVYWFPRYSKVIGNLITWMRNEGTKVILITSQNHSAVNKYADIILPCNINGISFKNSFTAPLCLTNYLVAAIVAKDYDSCKEVLKNTEEILNQGYYLGI